MPSHPSSLPGPLVVPAAPVLVVSLLMLAFTGLIVLLPFKLILVSRPLVPLSAHQCIDYKRRSVEPDIDLEV